MEELRKAEEQASTLIARARAERTDKLKGAKDEAKRIVDEYQKQKDKEYADAVKQFNDSLGDQSRLTGAETNTDIQKMNQKFNQKKAEVEEMLVSAVTNVPVQGQ